YGIMFGMVLVVLWCWWSVRRRGTAEDSVSAVAGIVWAPLAAGIALLINIPIRGFVERPRPFKDHSGLDVLVDGKNDFSFVSDHATMAMALGVG
ncbi:phosphatase PAP2 family protein, partial [Streptomyces sp. DT225]